MRYYSEETIKRLLKKYNIWGEDISNLKRHKHITIKEPHGRLIDADILRMKYEYGDERKKVDESPTVLEASK